jgi:M6 family metalloprotease-like protein
MRRPGVPIRAHRRALRAAVAWVSVFAALIACTLVAVPAPYVAAVAASGASDGPCALPRTRAHHSEGTDSWDSAYPRPRKSLDAVMVFLSFPDSGPLLGAGEVAADYTPATSRFFDRASYGRFSLRIHAVRRWFRMPAASSSYEIRRDWDAGRRSRYLHDAIAAADGGVDFSAYDMVYLVADPHAPGVDSDATKVVNLAEPIHADGTVVRRLVTLFENHPPDRNVLAHETGHVFDLPDLYYRPPAGSNADWDTHVGDWDLMGSQFGLAPDPFAWHKWRLGWLTQGQVRCVPRTGTSWHELTPLEVPGGTKLLVLRTGPDSALAIEARAALGNDAGLCTQGVLLYRVRSDLQSGDGPVEVLDAHPKTSACLGTSVYPPLANAPLGLGDSYVFGRTHITVTNRTRDGAWSVRVSDV